MKDSCAVAIVGIGGIFPDARTPEEFWSVIERRISTAREVPDGRWAVPLGDAFVPGPPTADRAYSSMACFVDPLPLRDIEVFAKLNISIDFLERLDPLCHLTLYAGATAFFDALTDRLDRSRVGVIIGNIALPTEKSSDLSWEILGRTFAEHIGKGRIPWNDGATEPLNRYVTGLPAGLLARALGIGGTCFTLDAACASSLYALKFARDELLSGRADAMITGGVSRPDCLYTQMGFSQLGALSPTGACSPFDRRGDGLVVGEGAGMFVIKRLDDALSCGDRIYAIVRGVGLSNDVDGNLLAPSSEGQVRAMRKAYDQAHWRPSDVDLVECHATGTPLGDAVEFKSLQALWSGHEGHEGQCVIGSVKSNVGHLLTGAGAAGLMKVILAMKSRTLPPTANFANPSEGIPLGGSPFRVLTKPEPWEKEGPRRAAVSAFGFGGINAHVLIEEWQTPKKIRISKTPPSHPVPRRAPVAVVGMAAHFGPWDNLERFRDRVLGAESSTEAAPKKSWWGVESSEWFRRHTGDGILFKGYPIEEVSVPVGKFRIPPRELEEMLPQQILMLQVASEALADARAEGRDKMEAGLFIGLNLDLNTTNFHVRWALAREAPGWARALGRGSSPEEIDAWIRELRDAFGPPLTANRTMGALGGIVASRIAREFRFGGPSFTISSEDTSGLKALEAAMSALEQGTVDMALVGAVDLAGDIRALVGSAAARRFSLKGRAQPYGADSDGTVFGEGAGCIILKRVDDAKRDGDRIYAIIRGLGSAAGGSCESMVPSQDAYRAALARAYREAGARPDAVTLIEGNGSGDPCEDGVELEALGGARRKAPSALASVKASVGHAGAAGGMASLLKAVLCLRDEVIPSLPEGGGPRSDLPESLRIPYRAEYWLRNRAQGPRRCAVSAMSVDGTCSCAILEGFDAPEAQARPAVPRPLVPVDTGLFIVEGENDHILLENIGKLRQLAADFQGPHIYDLGLAWHRLNVSMPSRRKRIAFLSRDIPEILRFIELAVHSLFENPDRPIGRDGRGTFQDVDTDRIFYEPAPLGPACSTAFVLPGSGNHYPGMGRALAAAWSGIMHVQDRENGFLKDQMLPEYFWRLDSLDSVRDNHLALIFGQVTLGTVACDILRSFGFTPDAVLGYSLGESAGLFARRAWKDRDEMLRRMRNSPLFTEELSGPCRAAKRAWGMPDRSRVQWSVGVVDVPSDVVRKALVGRDRVYLLIVNTPDECVIGGERKAVGRLVKDLGCAFVPIEGVTAVHCDVVKAVRDEYRELHLFDTTPPEGTAFYSAAWGRRYTLTSGSAADSILAQALEGLDFTGLINTAYNDGIHIFVELGPGGSCTRMIDKILGDRPHLARAVCIPGSDEVLTLLSTVGALAAHNIPVDLSAFYPPDLSIPSIPSQARRIIVETGGLPFDERRKTTDEAAEPPESPHPTAPSKAEPSVAVRPERPGGPLPVTDNMEMESLPRTAPARISTGAPVYATPPGEIGVDTMKRLVSAQEASSQAHEAYLAFSRNLSDVYSRNLAFQMALLEAAGADLPEISQLPICALDEDRIDRLPARPALTREQCIEFATGSMARVLGEEFAAVDSHPTRVRLPDEPLMLADRILLIEGEPRSLTTGRVVTEHDILPDAWYLDANRIPTCIAVEAGQADLFLSGYLGIDFVTKGLAVYRLLDAIVTFHRSLPGPGTVVRYDIRIDHFFRQGDTWLFRFRFDATIMGEPLLTMRGGCAGFFTERELEEGRGIVHTDLDRRPMTGKRPPDWEILVPMRSESYGAAQLDALRRGDLAGCFGHSFLGLDVSRPLTIPGGRMKLVDRVVRLDPEGGRFGIGVITAESDIHPDDWFLTCHFLDDQVMPGTLMYECCLHTLRIFLLRMGWVADENASVWEPVPGIASRLKCRGQVIPPTLVAAYEITLKEIGYGPEPYAIADALMYADGRPIVEITDMSVRLSGLTRKSLEALWERSGTGISPGAQGEIPQTRDGARTPSSGARIDALRAFGAGMRSVLTGTASSTVSKAAIFDHDRILAFATGKPSEAFGDRYRVFDEERVIARLPGPPYQFLDRITSIRGGEQWVMVPGTVIEAQYDVPEDGWYFDADRQEQMPYTVLLEVALQPCGWLAAYLGSALTSDVDLSFRNLGGSAVQHAPVTRRTGTLTTEVKITSVSKSGGMIIQHYAFSVRSGGGPVYEGTTYFGFFSKEALADQVGIKDPQPWSPSDEECARGTGFPYPTGSPFPDDRLRMIDFIECSTMDGGPKGLGFSRGLFHIDKEAWFFKAHFYQDPVIPGSLGLESLLQLMKLAAFRRWGGSPLQQFEAAVPGVRHEWVYRGQVIPDDRQVTVDMWVTSADDSRRILTADGFLSVDGRLVYKMNDFSLRAAK